MKIPRAVKGMGTRLKGLDGCLVLAAALAIAGCGAPTSSSTSSAQTRTSAPSPVPTPPTQRFLLPTVAPPMSSSTQG